MGNVLSQDGAIGGLSTKQLKRRSTFTAFINALDPRLLDDEPMDSHPTLAGLTTTVVLTTSGCHLVRLILRDFLRKADWYKKVQHPGMFELCALAAVHAAVLAGYGLKKCFVPTHSWLDPRGCKRLCSVSLGYFVHDFLSLRSMWAEDPAMVIHHTMGILLLGGTLQKPKVYPVVAPFAVIELSTVFLNIMTMLRMAEQERSVMFKANLLTFVLTFFATRIVWMPYLTAKFIHKEPLLQLGATRYGLAVLSILNVYWFKGIVAKLMRHMAAPSAAAVVTAAA